MAWRGMYENALNLLGTQPSTAEEPGETIGRLTIRSVAFTGLQQFLAADRELTLAESLCAGTKSAACGGALRARGVLLVDLGKVIEGQQLLQRCLFFARANDDRWLETTALLNLGWASLQDEHYDESLEWSGAAHGSAVKLGAEDLEQAASGNLGWAYFGLGDSERALNLFDKAEKLAADLGDPLFRIKWLKAAAYVYRDYGNLTQAEELLLRALALADQIDSKEEIIDSLEDLSHLSVESGRLDEAKGYIDRVMPLVSASGNSLDISYVRLAEGKLAAAQQKYPEAEELFKHVELDPASQVSMRFGSEHELARLLETEGKTDAAGAMYQVALATFEGARDQLRDDDSKLPFLANATRIYDDYIHFLVTQGRVKEALRVADQSRARTLAQGLGTSAHERSSLANAISPQMVARKAGATLLFYWLGEKQSYLWAVTPKQTTLFPLPAQGKISPLVERYNRELLGAGDPLEARDGAGQELYDLLVAQAARVIDAKTPVMVLTDGALSLMNFETLIVPADTSNGKPHYWIEDATLVSAPSLAMLAAAKQTSSGSRTSGKLLLLGDAVSPEPDYPELPYASLEMKEIEKHFAARDETVFARQEATSEAYLRSDPRQYAYIHFVSHGVASRTDPLDSAIILSRTDLSRNNLSQSDLSRTDLSRTDAGDTNAGRGSFKLYAREIMQRPIDARVVTISACYSSGARAFAGEGLVGLSWSFLRAGAHSTIGALWEVNDNSTSRLMGSFYEGLEAGQTPASALRAAKLNLLHTKGNFRKPFYWAPFQLYTRM